MAGPPHKRFAAGFQNGLWHNFGTERVKHDNVSGMIFEYIHGKKCHEDVIPNYGSPLINNANAVPITVVGKTKVSFFFQNFFSQALDYQSFSRIGRTFVKSRDKLAIFFNNLHTGLPK